MRDNLRKAFLLGLGALSYSEKKYQELLEEFLKQGESTEKEGEEFFREAQEKFEVNRQNYQKALEAEIKKLINSMGLVTQDELQKVKKELTTLKKKVKNLENPTDKGGK